MTVRAFIDADLVDTMHVAVAPIELGRGDPDARRAEFGIGPATHVLDHGVVPALAHRLDDLRHGPGRFTVASHRRTQ